MSGADLGSDRVEAARKIFNLGVAELLAQAFTEAMTGDEPGAGQVEIEISEDAASCQLAGELFELVELARDFARTDDGADGGSRNDVGLDACLVEGPENADMRPPRAAPPPKARPILTLPAPGLAVAMTAPLLRLSRSCRIVAGADLRGTRRKAQHRDPLFALTWTLAIPD